MRQTAALFTKAKSDPNVRVIILSGRGRAFTAGLDRMCSSNFNLTKVRDPENMDIFPSDSTQDPSRIAYKLKDYVKASQSCTDAIAACIKPYDHPWPLANLCRVICVMHGPTVGIGIDVSSACD